MIFMLKYDSFRSAVNVRYGTGIIHKALLTTDRKVVIMHYRR